MLSRHCHLLLRQGPKSLLHGKPIFAPIPNRKYCNDLIEVPTEPIVVPTTTKFEGKNVAYIGGFGSIGFQCCKQLTSEGIKNLTVLDLEDSPGFLEELKTTNPLINIDFMRLDITVDRKTIDRTLKRASKRMKGIDVLINGGAIINEREPRLTIQTNLLGLIQTSLAGIQLMSLANGGNGGLIVNVASVLGLEPGPCVAVYSASKHGVIGFTRACAHDHYYERTGITHMAICPGLTDTNSMSKLQGADTFDYSQPITNEVLKACKQNPSECARNMLIAMEKGVNGSVWIIDGGKLKQAALQTPWKTCS